MSIMERLTKQPESMSTIIDGLDVLTRVRNLNQMLDMATRNDPSRESNAFAEIVAAIDERLVEADTLFRQAIQQAGKEVSQ